MKNIFKEALQLKKDGYIAVSFGLKASYQAVKVTGNDVREWKLLDKQTWFALQALDKDPERKVNGK